MKYMQEFPTPLGPEKINVKKFIFLHTVESLFYKKDYGIFFD